MKIRNMAALQLLAAAFLSILCATASSASNAADPAGRSADVAASQSQDANVSSVVATLPGFKSWSDQTIKPSAALLCIHGLGLNSGAFDDFGTRMAHKGILVFAFDVRGFGAWMKEKDGEKLDFEGSLADIKQTLSAIRSHHPGLPVVCTF